MYHLSVFLKINYLSPKEKALIIIIIIIIIIITIST